jgi:hypothetical protein
VERVTTWQPSLWAQWLGWTLLYGLLVCGTTLFSFFLPDFVLPENRATKLVGVPLKEIFGWLPLGLLLGLLVVAFLIGVRFRSTWWGLGPPLAIGLAFFMILRITMLIPLPPGASRYEGWSWTIFALMILGMIAMIPCSLAGLAGVWWGNRRHAADPRSERARSKGDASTEQRR